MNNVGGILLTLYVVCIVQLNTEIANCRAEVCMYVEDEVCNYLLQNIIHGIPIYLLLIHLISICPWPIGFALFECHVGKGGEDPE